MANLIYSAIMSMDGYVADAEGRFDWSMPDHEVHAAVNDLVREVGTYLYGRRLYEVMSGWQDMGGDPDEAAEVNDFAEIWRSADKVVYSTTLDEVPTPRTRLERAFDADAIRQMKAQSERDIAIGGPTLAAHAFREGLVDDLHLFISPMLVGGGTRALPDGFRSALVLLDQRRFGNGVVHLHYRMSTG
jgi:dihydrofolate reductase